MDKDVDSFRITLKLSTENLKFKTCSSFEDSCVAGSCTPFKMT